jgi:hypothetical protein
MGLKKFVTVTGGVLLVTTAGIGIAPVAQADGSPPVGTLGYFQMETDDDRPGGRVLFDPDGDVVQVWDQQDDGKDVEVDVWNATHDPNTYEYGIVNRSGTDIVIEATEDMGQPWNMAEGHCYRFRIRLVDHNTNNVVPDTTDFAQWRNKDGATEQCSGVN